jgi:hypothetical protein
MKTYKKTFLLILLGAVVVFVLSLILHWDEFLQGFMEAYEAGCPCG